MRQETNTRAAKGAALASLCAIALLLPHCTSEEPAATSEVSPSSQKVPAPLNVVLITLDTTRADALNPYGQTRVSSPEIDRMAREGLVFEQVASTSPSTLPSHASILTGQFPFAHGARSNAGFALAEAKETLAEQLAAHGYRTQAEIAASVLSRTTGLDQGFERYHDLDSEGIRKLTGATASDGTGLAIQERGADDITRAGIQFLNRHADRPFFLWLHYFDPHRLYMKRPQFEAEYREDPYLAEVLFTDQQVGRFLRAIEDRGLRDHTLVVLTADHGEGRGDHGEASHAFLVYESTIRVPLVFWGATQVPKGRRVASLVRTVDILPTVLELAGLPALADIHGRSLARAFRDPEFESDSLAYGESIEIAAIFGGAPLRYVRQGDWKYVHQAEPALYDLRADPGEQRNLADAHPERMQSLRESLETLVAGATAAGGATSVGAERAAQLEALGYLNPAGAADLGPRLASLDVDELRPESLLDDIAALEKATGRARAGKHGAARALLEPLAERHPESATIQLESARVLRDLGETSAARSGFEQTLRIAPCSGAARTEWAQLLTANGEPGAAIAGLAEALETCPETVELLNHYAFMLATRPEAELRDGTAAVRAAKRALELGGDSRPEILDTLAAAFAETGDFEQAVEWSERSLQLARRQGRTRALLQLLERSLARFRQGQPLRSES